MDNSEKEAQELFDLLKQRFNEGNLKLLNHRFKRKYVEGYTIRDYSNCQNVIDHLCTMERHTSPVYDLGADIGISSLNVNGWKFNICFETNEGKRWNLEYVTWFKNTHEGYGSLVIEQGWNGTVYLNINNLGIEFSVPEKTLIEKFVYPADMLRNIK